MLAATGRVGGRWVGSPGRACTSSPRRTIRPAVASVRRDMFVSPKRANASYAPAGPHYLPARPVVVVGERRRSAEGTDPSVGVDEVGGRGAAGKEPERPAEVLAPIGPGDGRQRRPVTGVERMDAAVSVQQVAGVATVARHQRDVARDVPALPVGSA